MAVDRDTDGGADGGKMLELIVADDIEGIRPDILHQFCRAGIAVTGVRGNLEFRVRRQISGLAELTERPETSFVVNKERTDAETAGALDVFDGADDLILTAQTVAHADALGRFHGSGSIRRGARADGKDQFDLMLGSKSDHFFDILVGQRPDPLGLRDAMNIEPNIVEFLEQSSHNARALDAGDFKAVLTAVVEGLVGSGERIEIAARQSEFFQTLSGFLHGVFHSNHLKCILYCFYSLIDLFCRMTSMTVPSLYSTIATVLSVQATGFGTPVMERDFSQSFSMVVVLTRAFSRSSRSSS